MEIITHNNTRLAFGRYVNGEILCVLSAPKGFAIAHSAREVFKMSGFTEVISPKEKSALVITGARYHLQCANPEVWFNFLSSISEINSNGLLYDSFDESIKDSAASNLKEFQALGTSVGSAQPQGWYLLECIAVNGKLKVRSCHSEARLNHSLFVQFPTDLRVEGRKYQVESVNLEKNGVFYRASGHIFKMAGSI